MTFTPAEKAHEAEREINMRAQVYPRQVRAGKMSQDSADRRIAIMKEIAAEYKALAQREQLV